MLSHFSVSQVRVNGVEVAVKREEGKLCLGKMNGAKTSKTTTMRLSSERRESRLEGRLSALYSYSGEEEGTLALEPGQQFR